ncbi:hypothetical protein NDU88_000777 [Pleurodeles waltl]|uniref:Uncharacterized protein n=1 Tax=Pleurodeles waltl TaxID=8319 RepID=A0AAV7KR51_PLEWA|nr:hypothetical protein NDU88_000777 [Pleurodeles waltl]
MGSSGLLRDEWLRWPRTVFNCSRAGPLAVSQTGWISAAAVQFTIHLTLGALKGPALWSELFYVRAGDGASEIKPLERDAGGARCRAQGDANVSVLPLAWCQPFWASRCANELSCPSTRAKRG